MKSNKIIIRLPGGLGLLVREHVVLQLLRLLPELGAGLPHPVVVHHVEHHGDEALHLGVLREQVLPDDLEDVGVVPRAGEASLLQAELGVHGGHQLEAAAPSQPLLLARIDTVEAGDRVSR